MPKKRLNKHDRKVILEWMVQEKLKTDKFEKRQEPRIIQLTQIINSILRKKYPESDMLVLRKYEMTRKDTCLKFVLGEDGQVFGINFNWGGNFSKTSKELFKDNLVDLPSTGGCHNRTVFKGSEELRDLYESLDKDYSIYYDQRKANIKKYESFVDACRYLEDIENVVPLPEHVRSRVTGRTTALTILNEDLMKDIKSDFQT